MITINNLNKSFGKFQALRNVSVQCAGGQCIALIGPNGSGKTTLLKCILGMVTPDSGEIYLNDETILGRWHYRHRIGYMPQIGRYPDHMTVKEVFDTIIDLRKDFQAFPDYELAQRLGLFSIMDKKMRTLSGGTRQKVSAALAFLFNPDVLILDEPTAGLDPVSSELLKQKIMIEKEKGKLILLTSHILSDLDEIVSEVVYLQEGSVRFHKTIQQLRNATAEMKLSRAIASIMQNN